MELLQLEYFVRVAEQGSFSKASEILHIAQPTLSRKIRGLEVELRSNLFHRNGRGVRLTSSGRRFLDHARGLLRGAETARTAVRDSQANEGRVIAGLSPGIGKRLIPLLVKAFSERFPNASLCITDGLSDNLYHQLLTGRLDFAIMRNPAASAHLSIEPITTESLYVVGSKPLKRNNGSVTLTDLVDLPFIMPNSPHSIRPLIDAAMARIDASLKITFEVDSISSLLDLAEAGLGYTMIPESTLGSFSATKRLCCHKIEARELCTTLCLVTPSHRPQTSLPLEAARLAIEICARDLGLGRAEYAKLPDE